MSDALKLSWCAREVASKGMVQLALFEVSDKAKRHRQTNDLMQDVHSRLVGSSVCLCSCHTIRVNRPCQSHRKVPTELSFLPRACYKSVS